MKTAINSILWTSYHKHTNQIFDWKQFVREAAEAGYAGVELGGGAATLGSAKDCRAYVEDCGLQIAAFGASVTYNPWKPNTDEYRRAMDYAAELGVATLMTCGGFLPNSRRTTHPFDYDMFAGNLARAMKYARARGLTIAYHNHRGCIVETGAEVRQLAERLPQLRLCIDTGHLEAVGDDSAAFIRAHGKRIVYTHIKDFSWRKDSFVELGKGDGSLNVAACIKLLARQGYDGWLTVELDKTWPRFAGGSPLQSARACRRYLTRCGC